MRDKQMLISCVSFDSVNSEKCGQLLEIVIAFIHVSVFYCGVVSTFVIEIKSYLSFLVCPEQTSPVCCCVCMLTCNSARNGGRFS